jgi:hypothetical protein
MQLTYGKAAECFARARNREKGFRLGPNTYLRCEQFNGAACYKVRLHSTDIITAYPDDSLRLYSGGWRTVTTKARLNEYTTARIFSDRGVWYAQNKEYPFAEGMRILGDGTVDPDTVAQPTAMQENAKLRKQAKAYARDYTEALCAGEIGAPGNGDCWGCLMTTAEGATPLGGRDHIIAHFEDKYYVPSLVYRALERGGASIAMKHDVAVLTRKPEGIGLFGPHSNWIQGQIQKSILKHCLRELGL